MVRIAYHTVLHGNAIQRAEIEENPGALGALHPAAPARNS